MPPVRPFLLRRLAAEDGIMLLEVLFAILVLTIGLLGLIGAFDSARKLNLLSERRTSMAHRAQLEIERLQAIPYAQLAMQSQPAHSTETTNPDYYVNSSPTTCTSVGYGCYAWNAESTSVEEPLVKPELGKEGKVYASPAARDCSTGVGACEWKDGLIKGNVYDFVTWHTDENVCQTFVNNYKRVTVAVTATVPSGNHQPTVVRVSTLIANPQEPKEEFNKTC
jgi:Tfp pilus assembly protein PilV